MVLEYHLVRTLLGKKKGYRIKLTKVGRSFKHPTQKPTDYHSFKAVLQSECGPSELGSAQTRHFFEISESEGSSSNAGMLSLQVKLLLAQEQPTHRGSGSPNSTYGGAAQFSVRRLGQLDFIPVFLDVRTCETISQTWMNTLKHAREEFPITITIHGRVLMEVRHGTTRWIFGHSHINENGVRQMICSASAEAEHVFCSVILYLGTKSLGCDAISQLQSLWKIVVVFAKAGELLETGSKQPTSGNYSRAHDNWGSQLFTLLGSWIVEKLLKMLVDLRLESPEKDWIDKASKALGVILMYLQQRSHSNRSRLLLGNSHHRDGNRIGPARSCLIMCILESINCKNSQMIQNLWSSSVEQAQVTLRTISNARPLSNKLQLDPEELFHQLAWLSQQLEGAPKRTSSLDNLDALRTYLYHPDGHLVSKDRVIGIRPRMMRCIFADQQVVLAKGRLIAKPVSSHRVTSMRTYHTNACIKPKLPHYLKPDGTDGLDLKVFRFDQKSISLLARLAQGMCILDLNKHEPNPSGISLSAYTRIFEYFSEEWLDSRGVDHSIFTTYSTTHFTICFASVGDLNPRNVHAKVQFLDVNHRLLLSIRFDQDQISEEDAEFFANPVPLNLIQEPHLSTPVNYSNWVRIFTTSGDEGRMLVRLFVSGHSVRIESGSSQDFYQKYLVFVHHCTSILLSEDTSSKSAVRPEAPLFRRVIARIPIPRCSQSKKDQWLLNLADDCFQHIFFWKQLVDKLIGVRIDQFCCVNILIFDKGRFSMISGGKLQGAKGKFLMESHDLFTQLPLFARIGRVDPGKILCSLYRIEVLKS